MTFKWEVTPGQAFDQLFRSYATTLFTTGARIMDRRATEIEQWAKQNAPWTDRTGMARAGLKAEMEQNPSVLGSITLRHGVSYGVWLEIAYGGRWAIIAPAIDHWGPIIMRDVQRMMNLKLVSV